MAGQKALESVGQEMMSKPNGKSRIIGVEYGRLIVTAVDLGKGGEIWISRNCSGESAEGEP